MTTRLTPADLKQFTGSENWYRHPINRHVTFTNGAKYLADHAGAYWLLDEIALWQDLAAIRAEPFQVWTLTVKDHRGTLTCEDGNGRRVYTKVIEYTDFPLDTVTLWFAGNVIYLPSEH